MPKKYWDLWRRQRTLLISNWMSISTVHSISFQRNVNRWARGPFEEEHSNASFSYFNFSLIKTYSLHSTLWMPDNEIKNSFTFSSSGATGTAPNQTSQIATAPRTQTQLFNLAINWSGESNRWATLAALTQIVWRNVNLGQQQREPRIKKKNSPHMLTLCTHSAIHDEPWTMSAEWHIVLLCLWWATHCMQQQRYTFSATDICNANGLQWALVCWPSWCTYCTRISIHATVNNGTTNNNKNEKDFREGNVQQKQRKKNTRRNYLQQVLDVTWSTQHRRDQNDWIYRHDRIVDGVFEIVTKRVARLVQKWQQ